MAADKPCQRILRAALDLAQSLFLGQIAHFLCGGAFLTAVICHNAKQAKKVAEMEIKKETRLNRVPLAAGEGFEQRKTFFMNKLHQIM